MLIRIFIIVLFLFPAACSQTEKSSDQTIPKVGSQQGDNILTVHTIEVTLNGETIFLTELYDPLMDLPLNEIQRRVEKHDPAAMNELSRRLMRGEGIDYDLDQAIELMVKAAKAGDPDAQTELGGFYSHGQAGFTQNKITAVEWYRKAAEQGDILGQFNLATAYQTGGGVDQDDALAYEWFKKAADQGFPDAIAQIGFFSLKGQGTKKNHGHGKELLEQAASHASGKACFYLGRMYYDPIDVPQDFKKAAYWFQKGTDLKNAASMSHLGARYDRGEGVKKDLDKAIELYRKAAERGDWMGQVNLGLLYYRGEGVEQNFSKAFDWLNKAAKQNTPEAIGQIGNMYMAGQGVTADYQKGYDLSLKAAQMGDTNGIFNVGQFYEQGIIVDGDLIQAYAHYLLTRELDQKRGTHNKLTDTYIPRVEKQLTSTQRQQALATIPRLKQVYGL